jgi:hypothetical protein
MGFDPVAAWTSNKVTPHHNPVPSLLYGLELEIESANPEWVVPGMLVETDGSLRNNGFEFILKPMTYSHVQYVLENFFKKSNVNTTNYTERCSTHVHINVQNLTLEQVANICLVYQVFERVLFNWVGEGRSKNIFCVPWYDTLLTYQACYTLVEKKSMPNWQKYTALNLLPMSSIGTIEFRHLEGTNNIPRIMLWCRLIGCIYKIATELDHKTLLNRFMLLNTNSQYADMLQIVFGDDAAELRIGNFHELMEDGVLRMKYSMLNPSPKKLSNKIHIGDNELHDWIANLSVARPDLVIRNNWNIEAPTYIQETPTAMILDDFHTEDNE